MGDAANRAVEPAAAGPTVAPASAAPPGTAADPAQREKAGTLLTDLYEFLKANAPNHPALAPAIPQLSFAVAAHRTERDPDPFSGVRTVFNAIQAARRVDPSIPEP